MKIKKKKIRVLKCWSLTFGKYFVCLILIKCFSIWYFFVLFNKNVIYFYILLFLQLCLTCFILNVIVLIKKHLFCCFDSQVIILHLKFFLIAVIFWHCTFVLMTEKSFICLDFEMWANFFPVEPIKIKNPIVSFAPNHILWIHYHIVQLLGVWEDTLIMGDQTLEVTWWVERWGR